MDTLSDSDMAEALATLPGWDFDGERIRKEFQFLSFMDAIGFINRIASEADAANHHPDLENQFKKVTVSLRSWDAGGVTQRDVRLARLIEASA